MSSLNTIEFGHLIQYLLYFLQYILQKYPKTCGHFCCGKSSDNIFWTPHNLKYMAHMQNPDCKTFYVSRNSSSCAPWQNGCSECLPHFGFPQILGLGEISQNTCCIRIIAPNEAP